MALDGETVATTVSAVSRCRGMNGEELFGIEQGAFAMNFPWGFAAKQAQVAVFTAEMNGVVWAAGCTGGLEVCLVCQALPYKASIRQIHKFCLLEAYFWALRWGSNPPLRRPLLGVTVV